MTDEPVQKRQKTTETNSIQLSTSDHEEDDKQENHVDQQIEQEEQKADNIVIKDLMGSVKPIPNKVIERLSFF